MICVSAHFMCVWPPWESGVYLQNVWCILCIWICNMYAYCVMHTVILLQYFVHFELSVEPDYLGFVYLCIVAAMLQKHIPVHCQILFPSSFQKAYTLNVFWNCFHNFLYFPSIRCQQWWYSAPWWWPKPPSHAQSPVPQANAAVSNTCRWTTQVKSTPRALVPVADPELVLQATPVFVLWCPMMAVQALVPTLRYQW